jgi:excisionase family DNA binding protein
MQIMSSTLVTVEQAAEQLSLHPKTVLRHIREGRLPATRIGKSYRIEQARLDAFAGVTSGRVGALPDAHTTCVIDMGGLTTDDAKRIATFLGAAALTGDADTPPLHLTTAFDPRAGTLKIVVVGSPIDVARVLELVDMQSSSRR